MWMLPNEKIYHTVSFSFNVIVNKIKNIEHCTFDFNIQHKHLNKIPITCLH